MRSGRGGKLSWPVWFADQGGADWPKMLVPFLKEPLCWTPRQIGEMSVPQLVAFMTDESATPQSVEQVDPEQPQTPQQIMEWANKRRAAKGLPPVKMV